jgi:hypothetical protein
MLYANYFVDDPLNDDVVFLRHFRMNQRLIMKIMLVVTEFNTYFVSKQDYVGTIGLSSIQKCTTALRMLVCGAVGDTQ